jgi:uncharacterized protein YecE (DUF72 family)
LKTIKAPSFYSGLSGLQLPVPQYLYPPPFENASRLTFYASLFNSIEINSSFYKIPQPSTVAKWAASVPENFKFTFKLWKEITHSNGFNFKETDVAAFFNSINSVQEKKGCLLIQFPPSLGKEYIVRLDQLLSCIRRIENNHWNLAVEFRNKSWYDVSTYKLLNSYKAGIVIHDKTKSATPLINHESDFMYIRFHGPKGNYRDSYSEDFLSEYATYISDWIVEGKGVYVYFNNTMGDAFNNLKTLNSFRYD